MWESLPAGEVLVRQGDVGECMWFVVRGRLRVSARQSDGSARVVGEVDAGECVGEMALLSQATRAATVTVVRDAELLRLPKSAFDRLAGAHPEAMLRLARAIVGRLQRTLGARPAQRTDRTIALLAAGPGVPLAAFADLLVAELTRLTRTALLDGTAEARQTVSDDDEPPRSSCWSATTRRHPGRRGASARRTTWSSWPSPTETRARDRWSRKPWLRPRDARPAAASSCSSRPIARRPARTPGWRRGRACATITSVSVGSPITRAWHGCSPGGPSDSRCRGEARAASRTSASSGRSTRLASLSIWWPGPAWAR